MSGDKRQQALHYARLACEVRTTVDGRCHCGEQLRRTTDHCCRQCEVHCDVARYLRESDSQGA